MTKREMIEKRQLELVQWYQQGILVPMHRKDRVGLKTGAINIFDWAHGQAIADVLRYLSKQPYKGKVA